MVAAAFLGAMATTSGHNVAAAHPAPVAALSRRVVFQRLCVAGPPPGPGSSPQACLCWERNLQAQAVLPDYAVGQLDAAQVGGGAAYTVSENLAGSPVGWAMQGCGVSTTSSM